MGKRVKQIDPDYRPEEQLALFGERRQENPFPPIYRDELGIRRILERSRDGIGLDLEYTNKKPTILGIANDEECAAVRWDPVLAQLVVDHANTTGQTLVAFAGVGADRPVLEKALGVRLPLEKWDDSMLSHYLTHMELCKAPGKTEDDDDTGAMGMMNLWTAASFATDLPQWKEHDQNRCATTNPHPCPKCDVWAYCAIDSWAGLQVQRVCFKEMENRGTPHKLYRELMELSEMCQEMEDQGVLVDMEHIGRLEEAANDRKEILFPIVEIDGGGEGYKYFNPKSPKQIQDWFAARKINLKSTDKKIIKGELRKLARKSGFGDLEELEKAEEVLSETLDALYRLDQFKEAGKGLKAWFDSRWIGRDGLIHPRFIVTGTSTGRLASAKPNFQNVPARGFGAEVRRAVVSRPGTKLLKADKSQLELRMCLALAGVDPKTIAGDAFTWLVGKAGTAFTEAANRYHMSERDIAKSVSHGGDYLEGIEILRPHDFDARRLDEIDRGALKVYTKKYMPGLKRDWEYGGGVVAFTGANLAERLFGNKTVESRIKALAIQEDIYFKNFPMLREWQQKVLEEVERTGGVRLETGRFVRLPDITSDSPKENAKIAVAIKGQGNSAEHIISAMLTYHQMGVVPILQVHDELVFEVPLEWEARQMREFLQPMMVEDWRLPGFIGPIKAKVGPNWLDMELVNLEGN